MLESCKIRSRKRILFGHTEVEKKAIRVQTENGEIRIEYENIYVWLREHLYESLVMKK